MIYTPRLSRALQDMASYWSDQAEYWRQTEQNLHAAMLFCRHAKEEIARTRTYALAEIKAKKRRTSSITHA